jgi:hypothetical protein
MIASCFPGPGGPEAQGRTLSGDRRDHSGAFIGLGRAADVRPRLRRLGISRLPNWVNEALSHLEASEVLRSAMRSEFFDAFVAVRRAEFDSFAGASNRELARRTRWRY